MSNTNKEEGIPLNYEDNVDEMIARTRVEREKAMAKAKKRKKLFVIIAIVFAAFALIWGFFGILNALFCLGMFHLLMWLNIMISALCNALIGNPVKGGDNLYRFICILIAAICFGIVLI